MGRVDPQDIHASGMDQTIAAYRRDVDVTLLRRNLRLSPDERLRELVRLQQFAHAVKEAGARAGADESCG